MARRQQGKPSLPGMPLGPAEEKPKVDWIEELVGALCDPLIVYPSPSMDTLPDWIRKDLSMHRLTHIMMCSRGIEQWDEACDLEALAYMYPLTLERPIGESWTNIYLYLGTKVMGNKMPDDVRHETLTDYQMRELRDLKRWIHRSKVKARKERRSQEKSQQKEERQEIIQEECEKPRLF
jgi:hypothetical protein